MKSARASRLCSTGLLAAAAGLMALLPSAAGAGGGGCSEPIESGRGTAVAIEGFCYSPTILYTQPGDSVTWTNLDVAPHSATGTQGSWGDSAALLQGGETTFVFDEPGVYPYFCELHPWMQGVVVVGDPAAPDAAPEISAGDTAEGAGGTAAVAVGGLLLGAVGATLGPRALRRRERGR